MMVNIFVRVVYYPDHSERHSCLFVNDLRRFLHVILPSVLVMATAYPSKWRQRRYLCWSLTKLHVRVETSSWSTIAQNNTYKVHMCICLFLLLDPLFIYMCVLLDVILGTIRNTVGEVLSHLNILIRRQ